MLNIQRPTGSPVIGLIYSTELSGSVSSISITSIPATYRNLELRYFLRTDRNAIFESIFIRFNNNSGANYDYMLGQRNSSADSGSDAFAQTMGLLTYCSAGTTSPGIYSTGVCFINNYISTNDKKYQARSEDEEQNTTTNYWFYDVAGRWTSTSAINRIDLIPGLSGNFIAGCYVGLYGYR